LRTTGLIATDDDCVSRCAATTAVPRAPIAGVFGMWPGPNAIAEPDAPSNTMSRSPMVGMAISAMGEMSAHGHGLAFVSPACTRDHASAKSTCARAAFAGM
jgi:hypothetical protein